MIAQKLNMTEATAAALVGEVMRNVGAANRTQVAAAVFGAAQ